jgi:DNA polymerase I-like protein with 3'-5' exonuclease and polymerase domains
MEKAKSRMAELEQLLRNAKTATDLAQFEILLAEAAKQYKFSEVGRKRLREVTKRATYACLYGSTAENLFLKLRSDEKLRDMGIEITLEQCQFFVQMFPKLWPRIEAWRQQAVVDATSSRETVSALLGRKRPFPLGRMDPTQATNFPIQSTGADIVGLGVLDLWDKMDRERDWLILQIHDAIVVETDEDRAEVVAGLMTQCMTCEVEINGYKCLFPCETRIGKSWDVV